MKIQCKYLAEYPEHVHEIIALKYRQWSQTAPNRKYEIWQKQIVETLNVDKIPFTAIAIDGTAPVGFASVVPGIMNDAFPGAVWMITLYVKQRLRKKGIADQIMQFCEREVKKLGYGTDAFAVILEYSRCSDSSTVPSQRNAPA